MHHLQTIGCLQIFLIWVYCVLHGDLVTVCYLRVENCIIWNKFHNYDFHQIKPNAVIQKKRNLEFEPKIQKSVWIQKSVFFGVFWHSMVSLVLSLYPLKNLGFHLDYAHLRLCPCWSRPSDEDVGACSLFGKQSQEAWGSTGEETGKGRQGHGE